MCRRSPWKILEQTKRRRWSLQKKITLIMFIEWEREGSFVMVCCGSHQTRYQLRVITKSCRCEGRRRWHIRFLTVCNLSQSLCMSVRSNLTPFRVHARGLVVLNRCSLFLSEVSVWRSWKWHTLNSAEAIIIIIRRPQTDDNGSELQTSKISLSPRSLTLSGPTRNKTKTKHAKEQRMRESEKFAHTFLCGVSER
jgi:hypothetical protein